MAVLLGEPKSGFLGLRNLLDGRAGELGIEMEGVCVCLGKAESFLRAIASGVQGGGGMGV